LLKVGVPGFCADAYFAAEAPNEQALVAVSVGIGHQVGKVQAHG
jgi:hypothetical protein